MAMFTRRVLQTMLDHMAAHLPLEARKKLARELNRQSSSALGFEWETALLFSFSHIGKIEYEAPSSQGSGPDITFAEDSATPLRFTADITTVSDDGLEDANPATRFSVALSRLRQKYELPGSTHFTIKGEATGRRYLDRKMYLKLPPGPKIEQMLKKHVEPMFKRVRKEKRATDSVAISEPGVDIVVTYSANQRYGGGSYPAYTAAYSLTRNPVYTSLKTKIAQLKKSTPTGPLGIFLCDGGCALLENTQNYAAVVNVGQVVGEFFRQNSSLSFVVILTLAPSPSVNFAAAVNETRITGRVYTNPQAKSPVSAELLVPLINKVLAHLPAAGARPLEALHWIANARAHEGRPIGPISHGGTLMSQYLKVSARKIQEVLAGRITPEQFCSEYSYQNSTFENPFLKALNQGLTMESVKLTRIPTMDDDLLEFVFSPDAAIRPIVAVE
jgi:hypothetical protein